MLSIKDPSGGFGAIGGINTGRKEMIPPILVFFFKEARAEVLASTFILNSEMTRLIRVRSNSPLDMKSSTSSIIGPMSNRQVPVDPCCDRLYAQL